MSFLLRLRGLLAVLVALAAVVLLVPAGTPGGSAEAAVRTPVIVLHGITGAFLHNPSGEVWPREGETARSLSDDHLNVLRLQADGKTPWSTTDPAYQIAVDRGQGVSGVIERVELCLLSACTGVSDVYAPTFAAFQARGYQRGVDLVPFAFDWRRSVDSNAALLLAEIDRVRSRTGSAKVNLVAHSQGGLVVRTALADTRSVGKVARVATLGTPTLGATQFLGVLDYREPCQSAELFGGCVLNRERAQLLATNWPGALALLPSASYYRAYGSPINRLIDDNRDGRVEGYLPPTAVRSRLADRNLALIDQTQALHARIDAWAPADPSVQLTRFVGTGLGTVERVEEYLTEQCSGSLWWRSCSLVEAFRLQYGNGDGTVAENSADVYDTATGLDLRGTGANRDVAGVSHGDLVKDTAVLDAVITFLEGTIATPLAIGGPAAPPADGGTLTLAAASAEASSAVTADPVPLTGLEITASGPVTAEVVDSAGQVTGSLDPPQTPVRFDVPGASAALGELNATLVLTSRGSYRTAWRATGDGDVVLALRTHTADGVTAVRSVGPVTVPAGARLGLDLTVPARAGALQLTVDDDADGRVDRRERIRPAAVGAGAVDRLAPQLRVQTRPVAGPDGPGLVQVSLDAQDRGGSGLAEIEWALQDGDTSSVYTGPFVVPAQGTLVVRAVDRAGNVTAPYTRVPLS